MPNITNDIASKYLGKKVSGSELYDSSLIVAIPRADNRKIYSISEKNLPFFGWDVWHAYEFSALTENGVPYTRLLKIKYPAESKYIVESKSLKLYLNSYNMTRFGATVDEGLDICKNIIIKDLSIKLHTVVEAEFVPNNSAAIKMFEKYENILDIVNADDIAIQNYKETPELLETVQTVKVEEYRITFDSLRSNCRVTHQPDFGDVFIYYKSKKHILEESLLKYLISFRSEYHFHEECCEMIYKRLSDILDKTDKLMVCALYTRRGGIDICPVRWSKNFVPSEISSLIDVTRYARYGVKQ